MRNTLREVNNEIHRGVETLVYFVFCIATLGTLWALKIAIRKGIQEAQ